MTRESEAEETKRPDSRKSASVAKATKAASGQTAPNPRKRGRSNSAANASKKRGRSNGAERDSVIPLLLEAQEGNGYLPLSALEDIAERLSLPLSEVYGVATFYSQFKLKPSGRNVIKVCHGTACYVSGAQKITAELSEELGVADGGTTKDREFTLDSVACLGCCGLAPVMMVGDRLHGCLTPETAGDIIKTYGKTRKPKNQDKAVTERQQDKTRAVTERQQELVDGTTERQQE